MGRIIKVHDPLAKKGYTRDVEVIQEGELTSRFNGFMEKAGALLVPEGFEYAGFETVILLKNKDQQHTFAFVCKCNLEGIEEGHADVAFKELKNHLMLKFGRTPPRQRQ